MAEATHREVGTPTVAEATEVHTVMEEGGAAVPVHPIMTIIHLADIIRIVAIPMVLAGLDQSRWADPGPRGAA